VNALNKQFFIHALYDDYIVVRMKSCFCIQL